ncbi:MAG TPA: hypothetical protein PKA60_00600 [Candidatus Paceibacterota bacterium]|nr:hypothetical protein [Candidatus Paceibacterota bacterium]
MKHTDIDQINIILSETLQKVINKEISHRQANMIVKITSTLSRNIVNIDLKKRIELIEQVLLKKR